jgi:predicted RNA binding protein YcfA (HicA-like mRNA interferase family)
MKVRGVIKLIEADGWYLVAPKGSHRQYRHAAKAGRVTIAGHPGNDLAPGTLNSVLKQAQLAKGEQVARKMHEAIDMHVRGLLEDKLPVPQSHSFAEYIAIPA